MELGAIRAIYPFAQHAFDIDGVKMNYVDEGQGPVVVMMHGNPTWSFYYRRLIAELSKTHRVIVPDHVGCGLSDKPQEYEYRLAKHIDNARRLLSHLKVSEGDLVVHDWGGAIGMGLAVGGTYRVRKFVILNTAAFPSPRIPLRIAVCRIRGFGAVGVRGFNGFAKAAIYMAVERGLSADVKKGFLLPYNNWANRIATLRFVEDIPMKPGHPSWPTLENIGKQIAMFKDHPMQIHWGAKDWCFTMHFLEEWRQRFPRAEVHVHEKGGHYILEDEHEAILPAVTQFLA